MFKPIFDTDNRQGNSPLSFSVLSILQGLEELDSIAPPPVSISCPTFHARPHLGNLNPYQQLYVENRDAITILTVVSTSLGTLQHSSSRFSTGRWTATPQLYLLDPGWNFVVITTTEGNRYFQLQGTQIKMSRQAPAQAITARLIVTQPMALTPVARVPEPPVASETIQQPYSVAAAHGFLSQPSLPKADSSNAARLKQFCTACGASTHPQDRFCAYCGNCLNAHHREVSQAVRQAKA